MASGGKTAAKDRGHGDGGAIWCGTHKSISGKGTEDGKPAGVQEVRRPIRDVGPHPLEWSGSWINSCRAFHKIISYNECVYILVWVVDQIPELSRGVGLVMRNEVWL